MSFKAKNLSYESKEPAFLRRLRGEVAGTDSDRHERPIARPKRAKQDDEDDGPTYVLEESNDTLSKAEYEALIAAKEPNEDTTAGENGAKEEPESLARTAAPAEESAETEAVRPKQQVTEVGAAQKKRKAVKVGDDDADEVEDARVSAAKTKKSKKKAKAIKLSFGDGEGNI